MITLLSEWWLYNQAFMLVGTSYTLNPNPQPNSKPQAPNPTPQALNPMNPKPPRSFLRHFVSEIVHITSRPSRLASGEELRRFARLGRSPAEKSARSGSALAPGFLLRRCIPHDHHKKPDAGFEDHAIANCFCDHISTPKPPSK